MLLNTNLTISTTMRYQNNATVIGGFQPQLSSNLKLDHNAAWENFGNLLLRCNHYKK